MAITCDCTDETEATDAAIPVEYRSAASRQEMRLSLPSHRRFISPVISMLQKFCEQSGLVAASNLTRLSVALQEALVNAIVHGNLEVSSQLRDLDDGSFEKLIALRFDKAPYRHRRVEVIARHSDTEINFIITDEGPGFDVAAVPDPTEDAYANRLHGRGLMLMRCFVDEISYNARGNQVVLTVRRQGAS